MCQMPNVVEEQFVLPTRLEIVEEARSYLGTPFLHQGRMKGSGVDCIGLLTGVGQHFGFSDHDLAAYSMFPDGTTIISELDKVLVTIDIEKAVPADIFIFYMARVPQHAGILSPYRHGGLALIHTWTSTGKVVEHNLDEPWKKRIVKAYAFPGMENVPWQPLS